MGQYFAAIAAYGYNIGWGEKLGARFQELLEEYDREEAVQRALGEAGVDMVQHSLGTCFIGNSYTGTGVILLTSQYVEAFLAQPFDATDRGVGAHMLREAMRALGAPEEDITAGPSWILGGWVY